MMDYKTCRSCMYNINYSIHDYCEGCTGHSHWKNKWDEQEESGPSEEFPKIDKKKYVKLIWGYSASTSSYKIELIKKNGEYDVLFRHPNKDEVMLFFARLKCWLEANCINF